MENIMTIFYMKSSGAIKETCSGKQDFSYFGEESKDYKKIYDFIHAEATQYVMDNLTSMVVVDGKLKYIPEPIPEEYI